MSLEFEVTSSKGLKIKCSSVEAAKRLINELERDISPEAEEWNVTDFEEFAGRLQYQPRLLLKLLLENDREVSDAEIRNSLKLASNRVLAGVLSGVSKVALALSIDPNRVYRQTTRYKNGLPERQYTVTSAFRKAALDNDWQG
jgi:hypothetical protein